MNAIQLLIRKKPRLMLLAYALLTGISLQGQNLGPIWSSNNYSGMDASMPNLVHLDSQNQVISTGAFKSQLALNAPLSCTGGVDTYIIKHDPVTQTVVWSTKIGGTGDEVPTCMHVDANDNIYIGGYFTSSSLTVGSVTFRKSGNRDYFLVKLNPTGGLVWALSKSGAAGEEFLTAIATSTNGDVYVGGLYNNGSMSFNGRSMSNLTSYWDLFIVKYDSSGNEVWGASNTEGNDDDYINALGVDSSGDVYAAGWYYSASLKLGSINTTNTPATASSNFFSDGFLAKFTPAGVPIWVKNIGGNNVEKVQTLAIDALDNVFVAGKFQSNTITINNAAPNSTPLTASLSTGVNDAAFIARFNPQGNVNWLHGETNRRVYTSIAFDQNNVLYAMGKFSSKLQLCIDRYTDFNNNTSDRKDLQISSQNGNNSPNFSVNNHLAIDRYGSVIFSSWDSISQIVKLQSKYCSGVATAEVLPSGYTWYLQSSGGTPVDSNTILSTNTTYYGAKTINNTEVRWPYKVNLVTGLQIFEDFDNDGFTSGKKACYVEGDLFPSGYIKYEWNVKGQDCNDKSYDLKNKRMKYYIDNDNDGYDNGMAKFCQSTAPAGHKSTTLGKDCNDNNPNVFNMYLFTLDIDGDGYGAAANSQEFCSGATAPASPGEGYAVRNNTLDCDDSDPNKYIRYTYTLDNDNDGYGTSEQAQYYCSNTTAPTPNDGYDARPLDCDDSNPNVFNTGTFLIDADHDGYVKNLTEFSTICYGNSIPVGYVSWTGDEEDYFIDCDDSNDLKYEMRNYFTDNDNDGYTPSDEPVKMCGSSGYHILNYVNGYAYGDCDDANNTINPGATEIYFNNIDENCNNYIDEAKVYTNSTIYYNDENRPCWASYGTVYTMIPTATEPIYSELVSNAQGYRFKITNGAGVVKTIDKNVNSFTISELPNSTGFFKNFEVYSVAVSLKNNGVYLPYGPEKYMYAPRPSIKLVPTDCGKTITNITNTTLSITPYPGVLKYQIEVSNGEDKVTLYKTNAYFNINELPEYLLRSTSKLSVTVAFEYSSGNYSCLGDTCVLYLSASQRTQVSNPPVAPAPPIVTISGFTCGTTLSSLSTVIRCTSINNANSYVFEFTKSGSGQAVEVTSTTNSTQVTNIPNFEYNASYTVRAKNTGGTYGPSCGFTIPVPVPSITNPSCGSTLSSINAVIYCASFPNVVGYSFEVSNSGGTVLQTLTRSVNNMQLSGLTTPATGGTTYSIRVAVIYGTPNVTGNYSSSCTISTPVDAPTNTLAGPGITVGCNTTLANKWSQIFCNAVTGATSYRFTFTSGATTLTAISNRNAMQLSNLFGYALSTTYSVTAAYFKNGEWSQEGTACNITTPATNARLQQSDTNMLVVKAVPNPYDSDFSLIASGGSGGSIFIQIYDMTGRIVEAFEADSQGLQDFSLGHSYAAGVYNISITQDDDSQMIRIIKR